MRDDDVSDDVAAAASAVAPPPRKLDIIDPILSLSLSLSLSLCFFYFSLSKTWRAVQSKWIKCDFLVLCLSVFQTFKDSFFFFGKV